MAEADGGSQGLDARLARFHRGQERDPAALAADLLEAGRPDDAHAIVAPALQAAPEDATLLILEGRVRLGRRDLLAAQASLLKAARLAPRSPEPFRWLGEVLLQRGDPERAAKVLERAEKIDPHSPETQALLARARRPADDASSGSGRRRAKAVEAPLGRPAPRSSAPTPPPPKPRTRSGTAVGDPFGNTEGSDAYTLVRNERPDLDAFRRPGPAAALPPVEPPPREPPPGVRVGGRARKSTEVGRPPPLPKPSTALGPQPRRPSGAPPPPESLSAPPPPSAPAPPPASVDPFALADAERAPADPLAPDPPTNPFAGRIRPDEAFVPPAPVPEYPEIKPRVSSPPRTEELRRSIYEALMAADSLAEEGDSETAQALRDLAEGDSGRAPALEIGGGQAEDPDEVLEMLAAEGLFEPPNSTATWATSKEAARPGNRLGLWIGGAWVVAIAIAAGSWFGYQWWLEDRRRQAAELVTTARGEAYRGDHADLVRAERHLREARALHYHDPNGPTVLLLVQAQRALEGGAFEAGYLRPALTRAEDAGADAATIAAARAVVLTADGDAEGARTALTAALGSGADDPAVLYIAGRLEQRLSADGALEHLERAAELAPALTAPSIALAEASFDHGQPEEARARLEAVRQAHPEHLRAQLWSLYMSGAEGDAAAQLAQLDGLRPTLGDHGAPTDDVLFALTRASLLRRTGEAEAAAEAVGEALRAGASEPRLLALVAAEGQRAGRLVEAQQAATAAVSAAPANPEFRKLLARIQMGRRNGSAAIQTLAPLPADDPEVLAMRGDAALLVGSRAALEAMTGELGAYLEAQEEPSVSLRALRIRLAVGLGEARSVLREARALRRAAPEDPASARALGEVALATQNDDLALETLGQLVGDTPDDGDAQYLLGRAQRLHGSANEAEASFRQALTLTPDHLGAKLALASLLVDTGQVEEADRVYEPLTAIDRLDGGRSVAVAARLGRVEALTALGRHDEAQVQLDALPDAMDDSVAVRVASARLALAKGEAERAASLLAGLAGADSPEALVVATYADALWATEEEEPAADAYDRAARLDDTLPEALLGQAMVAVEWEVYEDAVTPLLRLGQSLQRRIRPPSFHAMRHELVGRLHLGTRDWEQAVEALEQAVATGAARADAHYHLGRARDRSGQGDAREAFSRYLELAPEGDRAAAARRALEQ